jgi:uncharacterized membrane protein
MVPMVVLIIVTLLARLAGRLGIVRLRSWAAAVRVGLAVMLCFTAAAHFNAMRADLIRMVPPAVPHPELMVTFTGVCEILGAAGLLVPQTRRIAAVALIVFLIAVLPANIHAARTGLSVGGAAATPVLPRIALQLLFIALVWWAGWRRHDEGRRAAGHPNQRGVTERHGSLGERARRDSPDGLAR